MFRLLFISLSMLAVACTGAREGARQAAMSSLSQAEQALILAGDTATPMRVLLITREQDSLLLRRKSLPIQADPSDPVLQHFIRRLHRTVTDSASLGVGIAAPQVGLLRQVIWVQRFDKENFPFEVYLNPVIRQYSKKKQPCLEGCLSIPDRMDTTQTRAYAILLEYDRPDGSHEIEMVEDFTAVIFQHEIDHLQGILYTDHLLQERKEAQMRKEN